MIDTKLLHELVDTIVIVMMENRSFDHILGHVSYEDEVNWPSLEGLRKSEVQNYRNPCIYDNVPYYPNPVSDGYFPTDLPHERNYVARQLACSNSVCSMTGFTNAYYEYCRDELHSDPSHIEPFEPMGFLGSKDLPVTNFLANNFAVCDHWFAPLPTSTHPNRCMALGGSTSIDSTGQYDHSLKVDSFALDWLDEKGVSWRVYRHGAVSSFYLFRTGFIFDSRFRLFKSLKDDINAPDGEFPHVVFIEPSYDGSHQNDNHPPLPVSYGELFLREIYQALTSNPERWKKTVMILTYDEHGGFFDHVPPLPIPYAPPHGEFSPFKTTGPRVPAILVSPLVSAGYVYKGNMDHTSILQFLAERFAPLDPGYSNSVNNRRDQGINSVSSVLNLSTPRADIPLPAMKSLKKALVSKVQVQKKTRPKHYAATFPMPAIEIFYSYSHKDEKLKDQLVSHLSSLKLKGLIRNWHDRMIEAGKEWKKGIDEHINSARIILLLISPNFMASDYCISIEVKRAMERHESGEARVIPIILRHVDWQGTVFGKLHALPEDGRPVWTWRDRDLAFLKIVKKIERVCEEIQKNLLF